MLATRFEHAIDGPLAYLHSSTSGSAAMAGSVVLRVVARRSAQSMSSHGGTAKYSFQRRSKVRRTKCASESIKSGERGKEIKRKRMGRSDLKSFIDGLQHKFVYD